jgi:uncharacterized protein YbaP (TraB family)
LAAIDPAPGILEGKEREMRGNQRRSAQWIAVVFVLSVLTAPAGRALGGGKTSVWKVSSAKGTAYLLGSIHMLTENDFPLPAAMVDAFEKADTVVFEVDPDSLQTTAVQMFVLQNAMCGEGKTLRSELGDSVFALVEERAESLGVDLAPFSGFKPWFVGLTLTLAEMQKMGFDPMLGVEMRFAKSAKEAGKPIVSLETAEYQLGLFIGLTGGEQRDFLLHALSQLSDIEGELGKIISAWKTGSLEDLDETLNKSFDEFPSIYERLVTRRNRNWVERIGEFLDSGKTHIVIVGVGHMPGREGLLELLAKKGYAIEQM